jgi:hypothetical protein
MTAVDLAAVATTTSPATEHYFDVYSDLEPKIRDLTHMAELARFHAINTFGSIPPDETEEGKRERSVALFAVAHLEEMVRDLERAYDAGWSSAQSSA